LLQKTPIYAYGRFATRAVLKKGDAVVAVIRGRPGHYRATELDDLGR
jgi:hypothetical protein